MLWVLQVFQLQRLRGFAGTGPIACKCRGVEGQLEVPVRLTTGANKWKQRRYLSTYSVPKVRREKR